MSGCVGVDNGEAVPGWGRGVCGKSVRLALNFAVYLELLLKKNLLKKQLGRLYANPRPEEDKG